MEKLIEDLIMRLEKNSKTIESQIYKNKKENNEKIILFLSGKILTFQLCIDELKRLLRYHKGI